MGQEPDSGQRNYAAYLEALCRQYEDNHLGLSGTLGRCGGDMLRASIPMRIFTPENA